eukprot:TRINITY_DN122663_c0_g1_i1.p1 TRINITY_DN122663_c0_g1~~TRINITY_DN122663_c0_g1_i1.p1  ORF type:complete len:1265 (+),score=405.27 TRINITY_DN122663_c0_g1_i1:95-3889(+)
MADGAAAEAAADKAGDDADAQVPAMPAIELCLGDVAEVQGLKGAAELNGQQATLLKWISSSARWEVKLPDDTVKALKPENLFFKAIGPVDDDGTLMLVGMATEDATIKRFLAMLEKEIPQANAQLSTMTHVISPGAGGTAKGEDAGIWLKLGKQADTTLRGILEDMQKQVEAVDSIDVTRQSAKAAQELKMARGDLIRFVQAFQERLEGAVQRLRPNLQRLSDEAPQPAKKKHGWSKDDVDALPLHEKYKDAFEKKRPAPVEKEPEPEENDPEDAEAVARETAKANLKDIIVKYQGKGDNPPASDNLYVKGLPGWTTEEDIEEMFTKTGGEVQSMKLKTADWGAICFVRLKDRKEAAKAIQQLHATIPDRLMERAVEIETEKIAKVRAKMKLGELVEQLERGVIVIVDISRPLGIQFTETLVAGDVPEDSQGYALGLGEGWRARSIGGFPISTPKELLAKIKELKKDGLGKAAVAFSPPPVMITFKERPFGFAVDRDDDLGLVVVHEASPVARRHGVRPGSILTMVAGQDVSTLPTEEVIELLRGAPLPAKLVFEQAQKPKPRGGAVFELDNASGDDEPAAKRRRSEATAAPTKKLRVDLSKPLGIVFDDVCVVDQISEGMQAAALGVVAGWKVMSLAGTPVKTTDALVEKVQSLKGEGKMDAMVVFSTPVVTRPKEVPIIFELTKPLGIAFDDALTAEDCAEGSQAQLLGIRKGWRALAVDGEMYDSTDAFVKEIRSLKAAGQKTAVITFKPVLGDPIPAPAAAAKPAAKPAAKEVVFTVDLGAPLGIMFDDMLLAEEVGEGTQAFGLGVRKGWQATHIAGERVKMTDSLVAKIKELKGAGRAKVEVTFLPAEGAAVTAAVASVAHAAAAAPELKPVSTPAASEVAIGVDLSEPLGVAFDDDLIAEAVQEGSQAERLGVVAGWKAVAVAGQAVASVPELVSKITALKAASVPAAAVTFLAACNGRAQAANETSFRIDLAKPLGIMFDDTLLVNDVQEASQSCLFGVSKDWLATSVAGEAVNTIDELVAKVQALKKAGKTSTSITFIKPPGATKASRLPPAPAQDAVPAAKKAKVTADQHANGKATGAPLGGLYDGLEAGTAPSAPSRLRSYTIDLSKPLGIVFDEDLQASEVADGYQAATLGVRAGWRVRELDDEALASTDTFVQKMQALKADGVKNATLAFETVPLIVHFEERPFGVALGVDETSGKCLVGAVGEVAQQKGIREGMILIKAGGRDVVGLDQEQLMTLLKAMSLPAVLHFDSE